MVSSLVSSPANIRSPCCVAQVKEWARALNPPLAILGTSYLGSGELPEPRVIIDHLDLNPLEKALANFDG
tara:strand:+ start:360 stop:569 length:210 start_codon:yes stop_codon:yes gene_type:complete